MWFEQSCSHRDDVRRFETVLSKIYFFTWECFFQANTKFFQSHANSIMDHTFQNSFFMFQEKQKFKLQSNNTLFFSVFQSTNLLCRRFLTGLDGFSIWLTRKMRYYSGSERILSKDIKRKSWKCVWLENKSHKWKIHTKTWKNSNFQRFVVRCMILLLKNTKCESTREKTYFQEKIGYLRKSGTISRHNNATLFRVACASREIFTHSECRLWEAEKIRNI